jgi:hypothetical protein
MLYVRYLKTTGHGLSVACYPAWEETETSGVLELQSGSVDYQYFMVANGKVSEANPDEIASRDASLVEAGMSEE